MKVYQSSDCDTSLQLYNFGFLMAQNKTVTSIINSLKLLEDEVTKEQKSGKMDENLPGLLARIRFIKSVLSILNILMRVDMMENGKLDDRIHQNFQLGCPAENRKFFFWLKLRLWGKSTPNSAKMTLVFRFIFENRPKNEFYGLKLGNFVTSRSVGTFLRMIAQNEAN